MISRPVGFLFNGTMWASSSDCRKSPEKSGLFLNLCDIMFLGDENVSKEQTTKDTNRDDMHRRLRAARTFVKENRCGDGF